MDLVTFSYDRSFVLDALRQGEIDYLEHVSEAAEADLFRHLIRRQVVQRLAETYPTRSGFTCPANSASNFTVPRAITPSRAFCAAAV
jgi:hypothetical protein